MKRPLRIGRDAKAEMRTASRWYEAQRHGLGRDFLDMVDGAFRRIELDPRPGSLVPGIPDRDIRRVPVRRFPFHVVYVELPDRFHVLAVAHQRRRPGYWNSRIPN
ncbi:type II toxin-antitoxin system RelE/ParE family toxin [Candidatus Binatia bacterium]|nr:type II toxin-antitoxin system RelE/ParE family toxin [Candidatus Binatia bacterium]